MTPAAMVTALVPVKARHRCKTRLAACLSDAQRRRLASDMLQHVVQVLQQVPAIARVVVLTPERDRLAADIELLADDGEDLNHSLSAAVAILRQQGCGRLLIVPADLPWLTADDIEGLLAEDALAITPSDDGQGTNGLHLPANLPFDFRFGANSFAAHYQAAARLQIPCRVVRAPGLGFDLDTPADYARFQAASVPVFSGPALSGADTL